MEALTGVMPVIFHIVTKRMTIAIMKTIGSVKCMRKEFKEKIDAATDIIVSCWDENNPDDGLTFDERLDKKLQNIEDEDVRDIIRGAKDSIDIPYR